MLQFLSWLKIRGQYSGDIELNFMIAGHTKFSPDHQFGTIKKRFSRTFVSLQPELSEVSFQIFSLQMIQPIFYVHNKISFLIDRF